MKISLETVSFSSAAHQVGHHNYINRTACMHKNRKPFNSFYMASSMDPGCPTTTMSRNMAAILQLICEPMHAALVYSIHLGSCQTRYLLTSIMCPYHRLRCTAHRGHMFFEVDHCPGSGFCLDHRLKPGYLIVIRSLAKSIYLVKTCYSVLLSICLTMYCTSFRLYLEKFIIHCHQPHH